MEEQVVKAVPICPGCGEGLPDWNILATKEFQEGCYDIGVLCSHCGFWEHYYYDSLKIRSAREKFRALDRRAQAIARKALTALINSEQRRLRLLNQK